MKINDLVQSTFNRRREYPDAIVEDRAASIKQYGLLSRIILRKAGDQYEVLAGWCRTLALKILHGDSWVLPEDYYVILDITDMEAIKISITENVHRVNLSAMDMMEFAKALMEQNPGIKAKEVAKIFWTTDARAKRIMELDKYVGQLPSAAIENLQMPDETDPAFTDAHVDMMAKYGAFELLSDGGVSDLVDMIISQEYPASKVQGLVEKIAQKENPPAEQSSATIPLPPSGEDDTPEVGAQDEKMTDRFTGVLSYSETGDLLLNTKKESRVIDLGYYHNFLREKDKFRVFVKGSIQIKPIE